MSTNLRKPTAVMVSVMGKGVSRKEGGKIPIDITPDIKCPNCGSDDFVPAELVFPVERLLCKSCGEIFDVPEFD